MEFPVFQFKSTSSCFSIGHHWKESDCFLYFPMILSESSLFQTEQSQLSQPLLYERCPSPLTTIMVLRSTHPSVFMTGSEEPITPNVPHQGWIEGKNQLPWPTINVLPKTAQVCWISVLQWCIASLCSIWCLPGHSGLFFSPAKLHSTSLAHSMYLHMGLFFPRCSTWHFPLLNFPSDSCWPVSSNCKSEWWHSTLVPQPLLQVLYDPVTCQLAEGTLCPIIWVINKDVKHRWSWSQPLEYATNDYPSPGLHAADHNPLSPAVHPVFTPAHCPVI